MPVGFEDILEFEKPNDVQVNVFGYDNRQLYPLKVSPYESEFVMDLLYDDDHHHYVLITHLVKVVCYVRRNDFGFGFCYRTYRNCLWICRDRLESYNMHIINYGNNAPAVIHMPSSDKTSYKFTNFSAT